MTGHKYEWVSYKNNTLKWGGGGHKYIALSDGRGELQKHITLRLGNNKNSGKITQLKLTFLKIYYH